MRCKSNNKEITKEYGILSTKGYLGAGTATYINLVVTGNLNKENLNDYHQTATVNFRRLNEVDIFYLMKEEIYTKVKAEGCCRSWLIS